MKIALVLASLTFAGIANAQTTVLDPGNGKQYLAAWCGGQSLNEYAVGWNADSTARTMVTVSTRCNGSGRGAKVHVYSTCWIVDFARDGTIVNTQPCVDETATDEAVDVDGAILSNVTVPYISGSQRTGSRAAITIP